MGHFGCASRTPWKILSMLCRTVSRYVIDSPVWQNANPSKHSCCRSSSLWFCIFFSPSLSLHPSLPPSLPLSFYIPFTVYRYLLQHHIKTQDTLLHGKFDYSLRRHFIFIRIGVLFAGRFGWKNCAVHFDFAIANYVLFADIGDYTIDIACTSVARQIFTVHNGAGWTERCGDHCHTEYPLPQTKYTQNGTVGTELLH